MSAQYHQGYPQHGYPSQHPPPAQQYQQPYGQQYPPQIQQPYPQSGPPSYHQPYAQPYPNQYPPQYQQPPPPQHTPLQHHSPIQTPVRAQPYIPHAQGQMTQAPSGPNPQGCYNCGQPDHFAQDCPEPKRATPAGDIHRTAYYASKWVKRDQPSTTNLAASPPPGYGTSAQGSPGFPYGHPEYNAHPQSYSGPHHPPAPVATAPHFSGQWQGSHQPFGNGPYQHYTNHHQPYPPNYPPPQGYPQHTYPNPSAPPTPGYEHNYPQGDGRNPYEAPLQQPRPSPSRRDSSYSGVSPTVRSSSQPNTQVYSGYSPPAAHPSSEIRAHSPPLDDGPVELDDDEIRALDVPDFPTKPGATAATPVAFPLPSNFVVADALSPFEPPNPENGGLIKSKYTVPQEALAANIRDSSIWDEAMAKDPALTELVNPPVRPITFIRRESRNSPERERHSFHEHRQFSTAEHGSRYDVRSHPFKTHHPRDDRRRWSRDRSRSPPRFERRRNYQPRPGSFPRNDRRRTSELSHPQELPRDAHREVVKAKPESPLDHHPPPPPPLIGNKTWPDAPHDKPTGRETNGNGIVDRTTNGHTDSNGVHDSSTEKRIVSPSDQLTDRAQPQRREPSEENELPRRRQADDVTPKHKRRQPKVAAAYSRRW